MKKVILGTLIGLIGLTSVNATTIDLDGGLKMGTGQMVISSGKQQFTDIASQSYNIGLDLDFKINRSLKFGMGIATHIPTTDNNENIEVGVLNETHLKLGLMLDKTMIYCSGSYGIQSITINDVKKDYVGSGVGLGIRFDLKRHSAFDVSYTNYNLDNEDDTMTTGIISANYVLTF